jgi:hypothetical protein
MQDNLSQVSRAQLIQLYAANIVCALIMGMIVALPIAGATFTASVGASCLTAAGCNTPTVVDVLVPVAGLGSWAVTAVYVGALQIRTLNKTVHLRPSLRIRVR